MHETNFLSFVSRKKETFVLRSFRRFFEIQKLRSSTEGCTPSCSSYLWQFNASGSEVGKSAAPWPCFKRDAAPVTFVLHCVRWWSSTGLGRNSFWNLSLAYAKRRIWAWHMPSWDFCAWHMPNTRNQHELRVFWCFWAHSLTLNVPLTLRYALKQFFWHLDQIRKSSQKGKWCDKTDSWLELILTTIDYALTDVWERHSLQKEHSLVSYKTVKHSQTARI